MAEQCLRDLLADVTRKNVAEEWLSQRADLAERTVGLYRRLLDKYILATFGDAGIALLQYLHDH